MSCANCGMYPGTINMPTHVWWCQGCYDELVLLIAGVKGPRYRKQPRARARSAQLTDKGKRYLETRQLESE